jgi:hypothetical protein
VRSKREFFLDGGLDELNEEWDNSKALFAICKVYEQTSKSTKCVLITWVSVEFNDPFDIRNRRIYILQIYFNFIFFFLLLYV